MASRVLRSAVGAAILRPAVFPRHWLLPIALTALSSTHSQSSSPSLSPQNPPPSSPSSSPSPPSLPAEDPKQKARRLIDALPGSNLLSKTAILSSATGASIWAISNEYFVFNEEAVVAICLTSVWVGIFKYLGPLYTKWADGHIIHMTDVLVEARERHKSMVRERIDSVGQLAGVVDVTKNLFEVSKETAELEHQVYLAEQKTKVAAEAKATLDSWLRYEVQVKAQQQKDLARTVIANVNKELENPKVLQQILQQSIENVEKILASKRK